MDQLILTVTAVPIESHVPAFFQALIRKAQSARTALTAEVHQENCARCSDWRASARTSSDDSACGFVSGRHRGALKKLLPFRATESVSADPEQEFTGSRCWHILFNKSYFFVPAKMGSFGTWGYDRAHS